METLPIPFASKSLKNVDEIGLSGDDGAETINFYSNEAGGITKVPGIAQALVIPGASSVAGVYWWSQSQAMIALADYRIFKILESGAQIDLSPVSSDLVWSGRPIFVTARISGSVDTFLFAANGAKIVYSNGTAAFAAVADAECPTKVTHVIHIDGRLLCNNLDDPTKLYFSDFNNPISWTSGNFISAESDPDPILALHTWNSEAYAFGTKTIEIIQLEPTDISVFSRVPGGVIRSGLSAAYSVVVTENEIYWLDDKRRFVRFSGRQVERISSQYEKEIQQLISVSDCYGFQIEFEGNSFLVFQFTAAVKTYVYNIKEQSWSRWGNWDSTSADYTRWPGNTYCYSGLWGSHLLGDTSSGAISKISSQVSVNGSSLIRCLKRTGLVDHKTRKKKRSHKIRFKTKRGQGLSDRTPVLMIRWKDDNQAWVNWKEVSLGDGGDNKSVKELSTKGIYRTRQWEFVCSDNVSLSLYDLEEDVELLR